MNLDDVAEALSEKLNTIPGLRAHSEVPQKVNPPAAIIGIGEGGWETFEDDMQVNFGVLLLLSATNNKGAQKALRDYCNATGTLSIKAALEQDNHDLLLAGVSTGANVHCQGFDAPAIVNLGGVDYIGVEFHISVIE